MTYIFGGELSDALGNVLSPIIKLVTMGLGAAFTIAMALKYRRKRLENPSDPSIVRRNMVILLALYTMAALFASFDVLLGWRNIPYANAYSGIAFSILLTGIANGFYFWFVLQVLYVSTVKAREMHIYLAAFVSIEICSTTVSLVLKLAENDAYQLFLIVHVVATGFVFVLILLRASRLGKHSFNQEYRKKFDAIWIGAVFALITLVLFTIDSFSSHVTVYSIAGWLSLLCMTFFLVRGYY